MKCFWALERMHHPSCISETNRVHARGIKETIIIRAQTSHKTIMFPFFQAVNT
jgi:hypothetical protein